MNKAKFFSALSALLLTALFTTAAQESLKLPDTQVPTEKNAVSRIVKFPAVKFNSDQRVILKGRFYYQRHKGSGWNTASSLAVNNKKLRPFTMDKKVRLLRRGTAAEFVKIPPREWWDKRSGLLIFFGDDKGSVDKRIAPKTAAEGNWYYLDITDFVNADKENTLKITNGMRAAGKTAAFADCLLIARDMEIVIMPAAEADKLRSTPANTPAAAAPAQVVKPAAVNSAKVLGNDNIQLPEMAIAPQNTQTSGRITFPAVRRVEGKVPILKADIFFHLAKPSGWNNSTSMVINGKSVSRYNKQGQERLLKRGRFMESIYGKREWWFNGTGLLVYFGTGSGEVDKRIKSSREEGFTYMLDVSDLLNYVEIGLDDRIESAKDNVIQLNNGLIASPKIGVLGKAPLNFKNATIIWMSPAELAKIRPRQELVSTATAPVVATLNGGDFKVSVTATGGLALERNGEKYFCEAAFSYPGKPEMKFDRFSLDRSKNRAGWSASVKKSGNALVISAQTADRKVVRTVKFAGKFLEISDAVTNLTAKDQPLMSKFSATGTFEVKPDELYLAGMQGITTETGCGANPTLYIKGKKSGLGVMALDDAFRCHLELARTGANQAVMQNPTALAANETYTQKQLLMLTDKADYFEFINALRKHLKLNHILHGPITLGGSKLPPASLQYRVAMAGTNPQWFEYGDVASLNRPREEYIRQYRKSKAMYKTRQPRTTVLVYTENSPATVDRNKLVNRDLLPENNEKPLTGTYGQVISKEATSVLDNSPWKDSILRAADGRAIIDLYYSAGPDMLSLLVYPYNNNHYQKVMFERTSFLLDKANVDGIYIDQFANGTMYSVANSRDRISYEKWDGRTVLLNPDGTIKNKLFDIGYACSKTRADYIRFVTSRGKFFLANTQPVTTTEAAAGGMRFYESDSENLAPMLLSTGKPPTYRLQAFAQLSPSPILLGCRPVRFSKQRELWPKMYNRAFIGGLRHGLLYVHYGWSSALNCYDLVNHMFPLTPVELGEGFVIGKERIVTAVSRKFITGSKPVKIIGFDAEGKKLDNVATVRKLAHNKFEVDVKLHDWNSSCVIVLSGYANVEEEQSDLKKKVQ
ncbi:MAG: hypothetical protein IKD10_12825 [Lentisphaeria bacterium]|nr:hypothetical protein [Lentisphaeria bacterium]MBR7145805.1 hypothetical protein [Lentisphaeria bacterium]